MIAYFEAAHLGHRSVMDGLLQADASLLNVKDGRAEDFPYPINGATALIYVCTVTCSRAKTCHNCQFLRPE